MRPPDERSVGGTLQSPGRDVPDDAVGREIAALGPWFHNLHLPGGYATAPDHPLGDFPAFKWKEVADALPQDLAGWRVLDIGCNAGYYTFRLAERGADVLGVDHDEHYLEQARWAARRLDPQGRTSFRRMGVYDLVEVDERFDLVLFLGVLYHLRYPLLALDLIAQKVARLLLLQTMTMPQRDVSVWAPEDVSIEERDRLTAEGWPHMAFIEKSLAGDETNWWVPNEACVEAMVRSAGLKVVDKPAHEFFLCEPAPPRHGDAELDAAMKNRNAARPRKGPA